MAVGLNDLSMKILSIGADHRFQVGCNDDEEWFSIIASCSPIFLKYFEFLFELTLLFKSAIITIWSPSSFHSVQASTKSSRNACRGRLLSCLAAIYFSCCV